MLGEDVTDEVCFVGVGAIEFAAIDALEKAGEAEVIDDAGGEDGGLGGGEMELVAVLGELFEGCFDAGVDFVFKESDGAEALAIEGDGAVREVVVGCLEKLEEAGVKRGADAPVESGGRGRSFAERFQGVLNAAGDSGGGISEGSVEVEEEVHGPI